MIVDNRMAEFQSTRAQTEQKVVLHMLTEIAGNPSIRQRTLAAELGIALGLMNNYLKRCITKGWIRVGQISPKRISYFLTPEGFSEKSRMVKYYLANSLVFFRNARTQSEDILTACQQRGWKKIALIGEGDLADIAKLVANGLDLELQLAGVNDDLSLYDAVMITDIQNPQDTFEVLKNKVEPSRLLTLELLHIFRHHPVAQDKR